MVILLALLLGVSLTPVVHSACNATYSAAEMVSEAVVLKFYQVTPGEWTSGGNSDKVAVQVSDQANTFCAGSPATCGVTNCCSDKFKESSVGTTSGYPKADLKDVELSIYLQLPSTLNTTGTLQCMVAKSALQSIVGDARQKVYDDTGYWITYVDDEFYGIPPASDLNKIIIPIACIVLVGIVITAFVLHFWNKHREARTRREKIIENRKSASKPQIQPTYQINTEDPKAPKNIDGKNSAAVPKAKRKDRMYKDQLRHDSKRPASDYSEDSAIRVDSDPRQRQAYEYEMQLEGGARGRDQYDARGSTPAYPRLKPLQREPESDDVQQSPEKKKKKKKKRSKSKEASGTDNDAYASTDVQDY